MTSVRGSRPFSHNPDSLRGSQERDALFEEEDFHRQMNEPYFRDYHLLPGSAARRRRNRKIGGTRRAAGSDYAQELAGDDDSARSAGVRRSLYDQGPIDRRITAGTVFQVHHRNGPCLSIQISIGAPQ